MALFYSINWNENKVFGQTPVWKINFGWPLITRGTAIPTKTGGILQMQEKHTVPKTAIRPTGLLQPGLRLPVHRQSLGENYRQAPSIRMILSTESFFSSIQARRRGSAA